MSEHRYDRCPSGHHIVGDDALLERSRTLFAMDAAEAAAMVHAFRTLPPHAMDEAMTICCRRPGDSYAALDAQYKSASSAGKREAMSRMIAVKYRTVRALVAIGATRDWTFSREQDQLQHEILEASGPGADATAALVAAVRLLIRRGKHGTVYTTALVENARGEPVRLPFAYTVGLPAVAGVPDLCIHMLDEDRAEPSFHNAVEEMQRTGVPPHGGVFADVAEGLLIASLRVNPRLVRDEMPVIAEAADPKQVLELILPDKHGLYPWQPGCAAAISGGQRLLGSAPVGLH